MATKKSKVDPVLQGLYASTGSSEGDTDFNSLSARSKQRTANYNAAEDDQLRAESAAGSPTAFQDRAGTMFNRGRAAVGRNPNLDALMESLQESGERNGTELSVGGLDGLSTDPRRGTLPLALQGLQGATYKKDAFGFPTQFQVKR